MTSPVTISVAFSSDTEEHVIMATSYGRTSEAGPRILRGGQHPDVKWRHPTEDSAEADAAKLRAYFASLGKAPSRTQVRQAGD